ncbi:MAG TPA: sulfur carrier protein ThiS adenylyltransferase ThiF [Bacteroidales bacterium]|nr:sulfur carrier protein ThiS adenylyltransferase ThiF [Bacteroidales bacterium]HOK75452.1 sulfur carrier protein ThiS adenylyltransferase ThiF [Bacteroidales bacterium]HPP93382.1 sulfur carrier protein ThiS adenylyltransferase ThiF [Bacteroidales bacterium]HQK71571.1 sulfur carrier protein ThiS adenylyltransferase ThiF [Bacteroidales bacterium]
MKADEVREHLKKFRVGIAGAGGLGSNCAMLLARAGVGTLVICDFDTVERSNLNRQFYFLHQCGMKKTEALKENLKMIDEDINVIARDIKLDRENIPEVFAGCDVIVEAFDRAEMKEMIIEAVQTDMSGVPLIVASGLAGWGRNDSIRSRKIDDNLYVCGDESQEVSEDNPPLAPRVVIVAAMQANFVVEILMNRKK